MARTTISSPTTTALAQSLTLPSYLFYIGWVAPIRLCSRSDLDWKGNVYISYSATASGIEWRGSAESSGTLRLSNFGTNYSSTALDEGVADVPIKMWIYDGAATATDDPVLVFDGVGDSCEITSDAVTIRCTSKRARSLFAPRSYINQDSGFSIVPPEGKKITWGGQKYVFKRSR